MKRGCAMMQVEQHEETVGYFEVLLLQYNTILEFNFFPATITTTTSLIISFRFCDDGRIIL